jgi:hypothetical protein
MVSLAGCYLSLEVANGGNISQETVAIPVLAVAMLAIEASAETVQVRPVWEGLLEAAEVSVSLQC